MLNNGFNDLTYEKKVLHKKIWVNQNKCKLHIGSVISDFLPKPKFLTEVKIFIYMYERIS